MRPIKFRAWDKKQNKMLFPMSFQSGVGVAIPNEYLNHTDTDIFLRCRFDTELMQFTGLLDKNGVEIYEGDLLLPYYDDNEIVEVIWHDETASYRAASYLNNCHGGCFAELLFLDDVNDIEVIGNVYENPHLLEVKE